MHAMRRRAAAIGAAMIAVGTLAGTAQGAGTPLTTAILAQNKILKPAGQSLNHLKLNNAAQAKREVPKVQAVVDKLDHAADVVSQASATSALQRRAKRDWIAGVREEATAVREIEASIKDLINGEQATAVSTVRKAEATERRAVKLVAAANKLLGITS